MPMPRDREILVARRPSGTPLPEDFEIVDRPMPVPGESRLLLRNLYLSSTPTCVAA